MSDTNKENKTQHLHILMAPSEVESIDEWGFANRIRTRGESIRRLCQIGLAAADDQSSLHKNFTDLNTKMFDMMAKVRALAGQDTKSQAERDVIIAMGELSFAYANASAVLSETFGGASMFSLSDDDKARLDGEAIISEAKKDAPSV